MRNLVMSLLILAGSAQAAPFVVECPKTISSDDKGGVHPPGGAGVSAAGLNSFSGISVFDGHPKDMADLVPDSDRGNTFVWTFDRGSNIWAACKYRGTKAMVAHKVPDALTRCSVAYRREKGQFLSSGKIECK